MELTEITFKQGNLIVNVEQHADGYTVDIDRAKTEDETYNPSVASFNTDEVSIDQLIEVLKFVKDYNFIQEIDPLK